MDGRGILEFIQQEILKADAQLFIDKGGVRPVDDVLEDRIGVINADDILLFLEIGERLAQFTRQTQPIDLSHHDPGRPVNLVPVTEQGAEPVERYFQVSFQFQTQPVL